MRDKKQAFIRLAEQRTNKVLKAISVLEHCANPNLYEYTDEEVEKIFKVIEDELESAKARFGKGRRFHF